MYLLCHTQEHLSTITILRKTKSLAVQRVPLLFSLFMFIFGLWSGIMKLQKVTRLKRVARQIKDISFGEELCVQPNFPLQFSTQSFCEAERTLSTTAMVYRVCNCSPPEDGELTADVPPTETAMLLRDVNISLVANQKTKTRLECNTLLRQRSSNILSRTGWGEQTVAAYISETDLASLSNKLFERF